MKTSRQYLLALLPPIVVLAAILVLKPFYGLMDDANLLRHVSEMAQLPWLTRFQSFLDADLRWGMFRPFYFFMVEFLYGVSSPSPSLLFSLNFLFVLGSALIFGWVGIRVLNPKNTSNPKSLLIYILGLFSVPWFHDLFLHPSLQEKLVFLAGALSLSFFGLRHKASEGPKFYVVGTFVILLGISTKAQFLMFFPILLLMVWNRKRKLSLEFLYFLVLTFSCTLFLKGLASQGTYTKAGDLQKTVTNLLNPKSLALIGLAGVLLIKPLRRLPRLLFLPDEFFLPLCLLGYIAIFAQWSIGSYMLSAVAPILALCGVQLFSRFEDKLFAPALLLLLSLSLAVSSYRSYSFLGRLSDLGQLVRSEEVSKLAQAKQVVSMNCEEGASALQYYVKRFRGLNLDVRFSPTAPAGSLNFGDTKLCPNPNPVKTLIWASGRKGGFQLYE